MYELKLTLFGDPILRKEASRLSVEDVQSEEVQRLIADMREYMEGHPKTGVGIAAPQLNVSLAVIVVDIKPTDYRPNVERIQMTVINPEIVEYYGRATAMWEGCLSFGAGGAVEDFPYAQTRRYKKIRLRYMDESGVEHEKDFDSILAHVLQHETDHLNGTLFVDRVKDTKTYMMKSEYIERYLKKK